MDRREAELQRKERRDARRLKDLDILRRALRKL